MNTAVATAVHYLVERTVTGCTLYLRFGCWIRERHRAQLFDSKEAAEHARYLKRQGGRIVLVT